MTEQSKREFFQLVVEKETTRCWSWIGVFGVDRRPVFRGEKAYRIMYKLRTADVPASFHVHHKCENSTCVNPRHLVALSPEAHRAVHSTKDQAVRERIYRGEWEKIKTDRSRNSMMSVLKKMAALIAAAATMLLLFFCLLAIQYGLPGGSTTVGNPTPIVTPVPVIENREKTLMPSISQKAPGKEIPPSEFKWWIEKNTPVALSLDAARQLRSMIQALIGSGANIEGGEDYREILDATGEAWTKDVYVTKGRNLIRVVSDNENPVEKPLIDEISAFRVANNSSIYFTDAHFVKSKRLSH